MKLPRSTLGGRRGVPYKEKWTTERGTKMDTSNNDVSLVSLGRDDWGP